MNEQEVEILNIINEVINGKYIGQLSVIRENDMWSLYLYLNRSMIPVVLSYQGNYDNFKSFIRKEIKSREMHRIHYWKIIEKDDINLKCNIDE